MSLPSRRTGVLMIQSSLIASDIDSCQKRAHIVTLSIGENLLALRLLALRTSFGTTFFEGFVNPTLCLMDGPTQLKRQFTPFRHTISIDLDIEGGSLGSWPAFILSFYNQSWGWARSAPNTVQAPPGGSPASNTRTSCDWAVSSVFVRQLRVLEASKSHDSREPDQAA